MNSEEIKSVNIRVKVLRRGLTVLKFMILFSCLVFKGHLSDGIITANAKLVELDLSDNAFGPDGVKACVNLLTSQACYSLTTLKLNNNGLGIGGGKVSKVFSLHVVAGMT